MKIEEYRTFMLSSQMQEDLECLAFAKSMSVSSLIRTLIRDGLKKHEKEIKLAKELRSGAKRPSME